MINQGSDNENIKWINGSAEDILLKSNSHDYAICILSIHHFIDLKKSFSEISRVLKNHGILLIYTYIPDEQEYFWLQDYFPVLFKIDLKKFPSLNKLEELVETFGLELSCVNKYKLHFDLKDNFLAANWRMPENYLKEEIRRGISTFSLLTKWEIRHGVDLLKNDLKSGKWNKKYGEITKQEYFDAGYRFLKFTKN